MNPRERMLAACRRQPTDRPPAWMMRQAGRSLPEYRKLREGHTFMQMCHQPELASEATLQPIRRFGMDAAVVFCDILVPAEAMGVSVSIEEGTGPILKPCVRNAEDVERLRDFDARESKQHSWAKPYDGYAKSLARNVPCSVFAVLPSLLPAT